MVDTFAFLSLAESNDWIRDGNRKHDPNQNEKDEFAYKNYDKHPKATFSLAYNKPVEPIIVIRGVWK